MTFGHDVTPPAGVHGKIAGTNAAAYTASPASESHANGGRSKGGIASANDAPKSAQARSGRDERNENDKRRAACLSPYREEKGTANRRGPRTEGGTNTNQK